MSSVSTYQTPPTRRPPLRLQPSYSSSSSSSTSSSSSSSSYNSPVRSFSLPMSFTTSTSNSQEVESPTRSRGSSRRSSYDRQGDDEKEIFMGALLSPSSSCEKRSVDVPCIILTEPDHLHHPLRPSPNPNPKQILLLPPTSLPLPLHSNSTPTRALGLGKEWGMVMRMMLVFIILGMIGFKFWGGL